MSAFDTYVQAAFHGGTMAGGPCFTVVHDAETPLRAGYADSIAEFFRVGPKAGTSAHAMVDPVKAVKLLPDNVVAWAAGPKANTWGWHLEQAGYASFTRADWTTADGMAQMHRVGGCLREVHDTWGIPKRWMTDDQLRRAAAGDRASGGMTTHQQISRALGGTTHTDPETNYPRDLLLELVLGTSTPGGFLMALNDAQQDEVYWNTKRLRGDEHSAMDALQTLSFQNAQILAAVATKRDDVDEKALAAQIITGIVPSVVAAVGEAGGLTVEQITEATEKAVRAVFADAAS